jgi:hypothetical protein
MNTRANFPENYALTFMYALKKELDAILNDDVSLYIRPENNLPDRFAVSASHICSDGRPMEIGFVVIHQGNKLRLHISWAMGGAQASFEAFRPSTTSAEELAMYETARAEHLGLLSNGSEIPDKNFGIISF